jgi:putative oxidoreductase
MSAVFSSAPVFPAKGLAVLRIITGLLMAYHGFEIFDRQLMEGYASWDVIKKLPAPALMAYLGKTIELVTGVLLALGLFTRAATLVMAANMLFICFYIGKGRFYYEDQHPFLFAMLALVFFFTGPGSWSLQRK